MKVEGFSGKESACQTRDTSSIPGLGRSPGIRNGNPLQYPCLENPVARGAWRAIFHVIVKSQTCLNNQQTIYFHLQSNEKVYLKYKKARILGITWQSSSFTALSLRRARVQSPVKGLRVQ